MNPPPGDARPAASAARWQDLGVRTVSAAALIPAVLLDIWIGGAWFHLFIALLCVLMAHEWTNITHKGSSSQFALHAAAALCGVFLPQFEALIAIAALTMASVGITQIKSGFNNLWSVAGVPYVSLPAISLLVLRDDASHGLVAIAWLFIAIWAADILAYFCGRIIGGPKLWPAVSPKKTWAGLAGAILGGAVAGLGCGIWLGQGIGALVLIGGLLGIVEQGGDLFESAWKRHFDVKDSGRLIPGHGGVLDRVDGLVAAAMLAALLGVMHRGTEAAGAGLLQW